MKIRRVHPRLNALIRRRRPIVTVAGLILLTGCDTVPAGAGSNDSTVDVALAVLAILCATYLLQRAAETLNGLARNLAGMFGGLTKVAMILTVVTVILIGVIALLVL